MTITKIHLKPGKDRLVRMGSPWVFSGAIGRCEGQSPDGAACVVFDAGGGVIGHGYYNARSSIAVRMLTRGDTEFTIEELRRRITASWSRRQAMFDDSTDAFRVVNSEGDFIPGLIVDRYAGGCCVQFCTAGMELYRNEIVQCLQSLDHPAFIFERSDQEIRSREGLAVRNGCISGAVPEPLIVRENGLRFAVDIAGGQKTGLFLDQRENRALVRRFARGARMLDCCAYTGGFSVSALAGGAVSAVALDSSRRALERARMNRELNGFSLNSGDFITADIFSWLRESGETFSLIVVDPPKFAKHDRDVEQACRGYKDINLLAIRRADPEAVLFTFSCSQAVDSRLFRQVVFAAAADSGRSVQVLQVLSQPADHPVNAAHREGEYLKGLVLRIT